jgi:L-glyceraldehyde 3-phosphate reductase
LTDNYLKRIPENSRSSSPKGHFKLEEVSDLKVQKIRALNEIAQRRNQSLAQMALLLKDNRITSVLIGASSVGQLKNDIDSLQHLDFSETELIAINTILGYLLILK